MAKLASMNPAQIAQKLINNVNAAGQNYINGIKAVQIAPSQLAVAQQQAYVSGVAANVQKWANNLSQVTLAQWQAAAINKGAPRLGQGVANAQAKITAFWQAWYPVLQNAQGQVRSMPKATFADRMNRMTTMAQLLHAAGQKKGP